MGIKIIVACSALYVRGQLKLSTKRFYSVDSMDVNVSKLQETVKDRGTWQAAVHGVTKSRT